MQLTPRRCQQACCSKVDAKNRPKYTEIIIGEGDQGSCRVCVLNVVTHDGGDAGVSAVLSRVLDKTLSGCLYRFEYYGLLALAEL